MSSDFNNGFTVHIPQWDQCDVCGESFPGAAELRQHRYMHTKEEIDCSMRLKWGGPGWQVESPQR